MPKNAPRKKGFPRLIEVIGRDFGNLVKLNLLTALALLPAQLFFVLAVTLSTYAVPFILTILLMLAASVTVGPALTALFSLISKMLRDEPGFLWHDYKKAFRGSFRQTAPVGLVYALIVASWAYAYLILLVPGAQINIFAAAMFLLSILLFSMATPYYFLQAAYLDLKNGALLKNSLLLALGSLPRSLAAALVGAGLLIVQFLYMPATLLLVFFAGYALPCLFAQMFVWPVVDKQFSIEATLRKRNAEENEEIEKSVEE